MSQKQKRLYQSELEWCVKGRRLAPTKQQARIHRFEALEEDETDDFKRQASDGIRSSAYLETSSKWKMSVFRLMDNKSWRSWTGLFKVKPVSGLLGKWCWKSTFLNAIAGQIPFDNGRLLSVRLFESRNYKQQDEDIPMDKQLIQYLREEAKK